ncbi:RND family efflux transporter MFP subunit [Natronospira proteinivora]|uniref:RND family efflux transporter MFP subunit n=1 Tax=Natronospira proteinivora TaxID=1807133 RepID=A0ABT1G758_9GAMM|nr:efflux RND transporter periplasmic adaptor subunit [Natronospira proteinivora]MCP1727129.1 RND family efflux transporter MFP subunit [Natronospira proteinivora]
MNKETSMPMTPGMTSALWRLPVLMLLVLAVSLSACGDNQAEDNGDDEGPEGTPVRVTEVEVATVDEVERSMGTVETFSSPTVAAEVAGQIRRIEADVGDEVEEGDVLARIEREPFELGRNVAASEVARLEAQVRRMEMDLQRLERLSEREYATEQDRDALSAELDATREQLGSARHQLAQAERDLRLTRIVAPSSGVVDERMISEGSYISAGSSAFRIQPRDRYRAVVSYPESVGDRLSRGMEVILHPRGGRSGEVRGELTRLQPAVDPGSRSVRAIVEFENPGNWRSGMTVEARVVVEQREEAIRVPTISLVQRPAGTVVYLVDDEEVVETEVETGVRTSEWVEIHSGLEPGDVVVTDGANFLSDGAAIRVREDD